MTKSELRRRARQEVLGFDTGGIDPNEDKKREAAEVHGKLTLTT